VEICTIVVIVELVTKVVVVVVVVSVATLVKNVLTKNNKDPRFYRGFFMDKIHRRPELNWYIMFGFTIQMIPRPNNIEHLRDLEFTFRK
jgi:hypothetical protein